MPEGNPFSDLIPGYSPPAQSAVPPIRQIVPPRQKMPTPQTPAQAAMDNEQLIKIQRENAKAAANAPTKKGIQDVMIELRNVIDNAYRAKELSNEGWFATGLLAPSFKEKGGTTAADVKAKLDTIGSNVAFTRLQEMREASPTGGALGQITERELDLLKSTIASLDQAQSDKEFQGSMQRIAESYGRVLSKIPGGRAMLIERGWLPKSGGKKPAAQSPRVIDFNDLP